MNDLRNDLSTLPLDDLSDEQMKAFEAIVGRLRDGEQFSSLLGWAGVGKTFLAHKLVSFLAGEMPVYACAPTHKAKYVLGSKLPIDAQTIHSFLELQLKNNYSTGETYLVPKADRSLPHSGVVVLDEASMVGKNLMQFIEEPNLRWVFVGDPAQLPPVNENPSRALKFPGYTLTEIVRQAEDNPIIQLSAKIRNGEKYLEGSELLNGSGVAMTRSEDKWLESAIERFQEEPVTEPPTTRVLCYHNKVVRLYNRLIRRELYGEKPERFEVGDWLMLKGPYFDDASHAVSIQNSEEVRVLDINPDHEIVTPVGDFRGYELSVRKMNGQVRPMVVVHEDSADRFDAAKRKLASKAREVKKAGGNPSNYWKDYFTLKEAVADVQYCFALTTHRSQGSTFENVYVDHRDLMKCRSRMERRALAYVACTRPSERLALLV